MSRGIGGTGAVTAQSASLRQAEHEARLAAETVRKDRRRQQRAQATRKRKTESARPERIARTHLGAAENWHRMPWLQLCEVCNENPADEAHHAIKEQILRRLRRYGVDFQTVRFDVRNRLWVCRSCHEPHTNASKRIHVSCLPAPVFEFADELKLEWALEREYDHTPIEEAA